MRSCRSPHRSRLRWRGPRLPLGEHRHSCSVRRFSGRPARRLLAPGWNRHPEHGQRGDPEGRERSRTRTAQDTRSLIHATTGCGGHERPHPVLLLAAESVPRSSVCRRPSSAASASRRGGPGFRRFSATNRSRTAPAPSSRSGNQSGKETGLPVATGFAGLCGDNSFRVRIVG